MAPIREGHTYMHLTYDLDEKDLQRGTRQKVISAALSHVRIEDRDGELLMRIADEQFGDALYSFIQALIKVTDVSFSLAGTDPIHVSGRLPRHDGDSRP